MQIYAMRYFNFFRYGEKDNSLVFDLSNEQKQQIKDGKITLDAIYDQVMSNPIQHIEKVKERGVEKLLGICGIIDGDSEKSNGAGKSTLLEGICYAHYEKIVRKTANTDKIEKAGLSVVTKFDGKYPKNMQESYVEELFEDNGVVYRLKRGRSFSKNQKSNNPIVEFERINENNTESQAGHRTYDTKDAISDVITMDYDVFVNSQMFGQNDAGKYLTGTDKVKKEMLISLLKLEDVVSGCLDLIRLKKNSQEKTVQSIKNNIEMLENVFVDAYIKFSGKQRTEIGAYNQEFTDFVLSNLDLLKMQHRTEIRRIDNDIAELELKISDLNKSDKLSKIEKIKDNGKTANLDKKKKEQEMMSQISEWDNLRKEVKSSILTQKSKIENINRQKSTLESKIEEKNKRTNAFNAADNEKKLEIVKKAKIASPISEKKLVDLSKEKEEIVKNSSRVEAFICSVKKELDKFINKNQSVNKEGELICADCKNIVTKEHIDAKIKEYSEKKQELEKEALAFLDKASQKDNEIKEVKNKIQKINEYLSMESKLELEKANFASDINQIKDFEQQLTQLATWKSDADKELEISMGKEIEYENKCVSIKNIFEKDILLLQEKINVLITELRNAETDAKNINDEINTLKNNLKGILENKRKITEKIGYLEKEKEGYISQSEVLKEKNELLVKEAKNLQRFLFLEDVFGLDGIQTRIIKRYLPLLNVYIKEFLDILSGGQISIKMIINERSKVDLVISGGTADTFDMLSGGEKKIIRLATDIGMSLLAFSKSAQKPEIIFLDEIFGDLDASHKETVFMMLKRLQDKFNRVLIISHEEEIKKMLQNNIVIEKGIGKNGLSQIKRIE